MVSKDYVLKKVFLGIRFQANTKTQILLKNSKLILNFGTLLSVAVEPVDKQDIRLKTFVNLDFIPLEFIS